MSLSDTSDDARYEALLARDARFDGLFFVGVRTTGIYCRPVCRARVPRRASCVFFGSAVAAEHEGFRACFVCRPELAPGAPAAPRSSLVATAIAAIEDGALDEGSLEGLAERLGTGARTLRRAFVAELGVTPQELAASRRLATAKRLLHDTRLPMIDVAHASGFASLRRFNAAFVERFGSAPSRLRHDRAAQGSYPGSGFRLRLHARPPFPVEEIFAFFAARALEGIERGTRSSYARTLLVDGVAGAFSATADGRGIVAEVDVSLAPKAEKVARILRRIFDTDARPVTIDAHLASDPVLAPLVAARPGLRVPGAPTAFEAAVRAVVGQRISVVAARTIVRRLVGRLGQKVENVSFGLGRLFPEPEALVRAGVDALASLGLPRARAEALFAVAELATRGGLEGPSRDVAERLLALRGIGPFTSGYVAMRGLADPDGFPDGDLVVARAFGTTPRALAARLASVRPFRAYATLHVYAAASREEKTS